MSDTLTLDLDPAVLRHHALLAACAARVPPGELYALGQGLLVLRLAVPDCRDCVRWHVADLAGARCVFEATIGPLCGVVVTRDVPGAWEGRMQAWAGEA